MKKLFLMGFVALAFASCVSDKEVTVQTQEQKYEAAFENFIGGQVGANVNWGFNDQKVAVFDANHKFIGMRGSYPNNNEWGMTMYVPEEMTAAQKAKVENYFTNVKKPQGISVNWSDFFVHQVSRTEKGPFMNYLYCGEHDLAIKDHVYNFNGGGSTDKKNVGVEPLDEHNARQVDYYDGIQLVQNSSTAFFAFHNSYDDTYYEKNFVMVSGEMIDEVYPGEPSVAGMWFVGFDYEHHKQKDNDTRDDVERDFYFNDWVIRVSPGFYRNSQRIMVEDLIANDLSQVDKSAFLTTSTWDPSIGEYGGNAITVDETIITLWAAGGTKSLTIDGKEVHELFGVNKTTMVNTNASEKALNGVDGLTPVIFRVSNPSAPNANLIPVYVGSTELKAEKGKAPQKIEVSNTTKWMKERVIITEGYPKFAEYATSENGTPADWYKDVTTDASKLYNGPIK